MLRFFSLLLASSLSVPAFAQQTKVTGLYSNLHYIQEAGDVLGTEVFISYSTGGYFAWVQCAQGTPSEPVLVPVTVAGMTVTFAIPQESQSQCAGGGFSGIVSQSELKGEWKFNDAAHLETLKRKKSYWQ